MTQYQNKIIKPGVGLLNLAEQLGNVSQACKVMGYSRDTFWDCLEKGRRDCMMEGIRYNVCETI
jgi:molybdenum-dependent DNA-binding transcriptional regulator ModE